MTSPTKAATDASDLVPADASAGAEGAGRKPGEPAGRSPGQLAWARFKRDKTGIICAVVVAVFLLISLFAPLITKLYGKNPYTLYGKEDNLLNGYGMPIKPNGGIDAQHWFGIEPGLGRDIFALLMYGIRTSLGIALAVTVLMVVVGMLIGLLQGYMGGRTDYFLGRITDLLMSFPQQLFYIAFTPVIIAMFVSPSEEEPTYIRVAALIAVQAVLTWMGISRLIRVQALSLREREFVEAARLSGASTWRIIRKEILPNLWSTILVQATLWLPANVTAEAGLSYLGVGMMPPTPDWGLLFQDAANYYQSDITFMFFPGIALALFVVAFNLLGDSVRDALDPKTIR